MTLIPGIAVFQKSLAALPIAAYQPGETVLTAGSKTGANRVLLHSWRGALALARPHPLHWSSDHAPDNSRSNASRFATHLPPTFFADLIWPRTSMWWVCLGVRPITLPISSMPQASGWLLEKFVFS